jgi:hypothetical protein
MTIPAFSPSTIRSWPARHTVAETLTQGLRGTVITLPYGLGLSEVQTIVETLLQLIDLPPTPVPAEPWPPVTPAQGALWLIPHAVVTPPEAVRNCIVVCQLQAAPGLRRLALPREIRRLTEALMDVAAMHLSSLRQATTILSLADTPFPLIAALDALLGAPALTTTEPGERQRRMIVHAAAALLRGVPTEIGEWTLALLTQEPLPQQFVSSKTSEMGQDIAVARAFEVGLVLSLQEPGVHEFHWRPALEALGKLLASEQERGATLDLLRPLLALPLQGLLDRLSSPAEALPTLPLPPRRPPLFAHTSAVQRLVELLAPASVIRTAVLVSEAWKTDVAFLVIDRLSSKRTPLWLNFSQGPGRAFRRLAAELEIDIDERWSVEEDRLGIPRWVSFVQERLLSLSVLIIADDTDGLSDEQLVAVLPRGPGRCATLVFSERRRSILERTHDAPHVVLEPPSHEQIRQVLLEASGLPAEGWPSLEKALGPLARSPALLPPVARALSLVGPERALSWSQENEVARGFSPTLFLALFDLLRTLDPRHTMLLELLAVAPEHGLPREIIARIDPELPGAIEELVRWGFVWGHDGCLGVSPFARALTSQHSEGSDAWFQLRRQIIDATVAVSNLLSPYLEQPRAVQIEQIVDSCLHWVLSPDTRIPEETARSYQVSLIRFLVMYPIRGSQKENILLSQNLRSLLLSVPGSSQSLRGEILFLLGVSLNKYDQKEEAKRCLLSALAIFSSTNEWPVHPTYLACELVFQAGDAPEIRAPALGLLEKSMQSSNKIDAAMSKLAWCRLQGDKDPPLAPGQRIHVLEEIVLASNAMPAGCKRIRALAYLDIGWVHVHSKNWPEAIQSFETCRSISGRRLPSLWAIACSSLAFCFFRMEGGDRKELLQRALSEIHLSLLVFQSHLYPDTYKNSKKEEADILREMAVLQK